MLLTSGTTTVTTDPASSPPQMIVVTWSKTETTITAHIPHVAGETHFAFDLLNNEGARWDGTGTGTLAMFGGNGASDSGATHITLTGLTPGTAYEVRAHVGDYAFPDQP